MTEVANDDLAPLSTAAAALLVATTYNRSWETTLPITALPVHTHEDAAQGGQIDKDALHFSASPRVLGRATAGAGSGEELPVTGGGSTVVFSDTPTLTTPRVDAVLPLTESAGLAFNADPGTVNGFELYVTASGNTPYLKANGADAAVSFNLKTKGAGIVQANGVEVVTTTVAQTLSGPKTLTLPVIGDFTNATHNHTSNATGGTLGAAALGSGSALSVLGRSSGTSGTRADITAVDGSGAVLRESGSSLGFGTITTAALASTTGSGTTVALGTSPTLNTPLIAIVYGSNSSPGGMTIQANSADSTGAISFASELNFANLGGPTASTGHFGRNGNFLEYRASSGTQRLIAVPGTAAQGDVAYFDGTAWARLATGTSGQFLKTLGAGANPAWASVTGTAPSMQVFTASATATYTTPAGVTAIMVEIVGAGGGGGGAAQAAVQSAGAGGGGGGSYCRKLIVSPAATYSYVVGAGGAAGAAGNNNGSAGTATTFSTLTAPGGSGGTGAAAGTAIAIVAGGTGGAVATGGDLNGGGQCGNLGFTLGAAIAFGGVGGVAGGGWGSGSNNRLTEAAGLAGIGHGAGGGGGCCLGTTAKAGAAGKDGALYVTEYK